MKSARKTTPYKKTEWLVWPTLHANATFIVNKYTALGWHVWSRKDMGDGRTEITFYR